VTILDVVYVIVYDALSRCFVALLSVVYLDLLRPPHRELYRYFIRRLRAKDFGILSEV
jgi:hypothetical protein